MPKLIRIIDRLNIGGPAIHVTLLAERLRGAGYETLLVHGREDAHEGSMRYLLDGRDVRTCFIPQLGRSVNPFRDLVVLWKLWRLMRRERPAIVHTHKSKAGLLGRLAAVLARVPIRVHTFHGHIFHGYFGERKTRLYIRLERWLARRTTRIIALSESQKRDLCEAYRIAEPERVAVVPLGFELDRFTDVERHRGAFRRRLGVGDDVRLVGIVGRLAPIKNHELFLQGAKRVAAKRPDVRFVIVGDGEQREALETRAGELDLGDRVIFSGWETVIEEVYADLAVVALTSRNEGTPVCLIEAMACGVRVVATDVGGVSDVLGGGRFGALVPPDDPDALARALEAALAEPSPPAEARAHAHSLYSADALASRIAELYKELSG